MKTTHKPIAAILFSLLATSAAIAQTATTNQPDSMGRQEPVSMARRGHGGRDRDMPGPDGRDHVGPGRDRPSRDMPGQDGPGGKGGPRKGGRKGGFEGREAFGRHALTPLTTLTGSVQQLTANDEGVLDGFSINANNAVTVVRFAPHLGQSVMKAVKVGSQATVTGFVSTNREAESVFRLTKLEAGKTVVMDAPPIRPATPPTPTLTTVTGKVADYQLNRKGRTTGLILDNKTLVRVPPHVAYQLNTLVAKGATVTVDGYVKPLDEGQVQLEKRNIIRASVLTIDGKQYLVR